MSSTAGRAATALAHYPGRSVDRHPIARGHVAIAAELEPPFRAALGWA